MEVGVLIFLLLIALAVYISLRVYSTNKKKRKVYRKRYQPYQPYRPYQPSHLDSSRRASYQSEQSTPTTRSSPTYQPQTKPSYTPSYSPRRTPVVTNNADDYYRAGMYDRAKEEYLKTGRIFGAAKSVASKGKEYVKEALEIIKQYAPEREEEMIRNLSRYFFDSGEVELSAQVLYDYNLIEEAKAVLATIGKSIDDIVEPKSVEISTFSSTEPFMSSTETETETIISSFASDTEPISDAREELRVLANEEETEPIEPFSSQVEETKKIEPQKLKIATVDLEERCTVCLGEIKAGESFVRCPHCGKPSHYSHLVEWLKVKTQCPNCRNKLSLNMFKT
ncbi:MAG: E3 ubiquitin protein ligase [Candidatus Heimdallarchaeum endolithica]|uniref:E3 ubiquitin protein ligase n=1 Tax=Candidatus Heimdallarchaeum endolithica TaxID=2876572 RepID=A0A9Y1BQG8_9ARCH|nr:MAG: E3 ubiquitin protein ligase [Candidatus Heimdallarchaeum endolithica]